MRKSMIFIFVLLLFSTFIYAVGDTAKGGQAGDTAKGGQAGDTAKGGQEGDTAKGGQAGDTAKGGQSGDDNQLLYGGIGVLIGAAGGFLVGKSMGNKK